MINLMSLVKKNQQVFTQHLLSQVDHIGSALNTIGIKNNINRHTLVSQAWVQKHRIEGEITRFDMMLHHRLKPIKTIRNKIDSRLDEVIDCLPAPVAKQAHRTHHRIKRLSGGC